MTRPRIVGITGTTGAGKSTLAAAIEQVAPQDVAVLDQDWYFLPRSVCPAGANFFEPRWFRTDEFIRDVVKLSEGSEILAPRLDEEFFEPLPPVPLAPKRFVVLTGMTLLRIPEVDRCLHARFYLDPGMNVIAERKHVRDKLIRKKPDWVITEEIRWGTAEYEADSCIRARTDVRTVGLPYKAAALAEELLTALRKDLDVENRPDALP